MELTELLVRIRATNSAGCWSRGSRQLAGYLVRWLAKRVETRHRRRRFAEDRSLLRDMSDGDLLDIGVGRCEVGRITDPASLRSHLETERETDMI